MIEAYFIGIGNELLQGKIQDQNLHWLGRFLFKHNIYLKQCVQVRDISEDLMAVLETASKNADLIIASGGLGPTEDDLTKMIVANWFKLPIQESEEAKKIVVQQYEEKGRPYNTEKFDYHKIPKGFEALHNRVGYAPGLYYQSEKKKYIFLPGVPSEFQGIIEDHLLMRVPATDHIQENLIYKTWGIPESHIFHKLEPQLWEKLKSYGTVSSLPHLSGVDIGVTVHGKNEAEIQEAQKQVTDVMNQSALRPHIWHIGEHLIQEVIHEKLIQKKKTLATAESCTGGLIVDKLTDLSGSSQYLLGSTVTYATEAKVKILGVNPDTIKKYNVVSEQVAGEMVKKVRELYGSDYALSTTGVAGPTGGTEEIPVGTICIGIAVGEKIITKTFHLKGCRRTLKIRFAEFALHCLNEEISVGNI